MAEWSVTHPLYTPFDILLETPTQVSLKTLQPWCKDAQAQAKDWSPHMLYDTGQSMLEQYPYAVLESQLAAFDGSHEAANDLAHSRRILMIGRDCLSLAIPNLRDIRQYRSLFDVTNALGRLADGEAVIGKTLTASIDVLSNMHLNDADVSTKHNVATVVRRSTHSAIPVLSKPKAASKNGTVHNYHASRRHLRRVVHGAMAAAINDPTAARQKLALQGVALNRATGAKKNKLYRAMSRQVLEQSVL